MAGLDITEEPQIGYKLLRLRRDGTLGPLFINRELVVPVGQWLRAEDHPTQGFAHRPGWHVSPKPHAPHLSMKNRIWVKVEIDDYDELHRPKSQGGMWWIAKWMRVIDEV
jgi:hypothetical protein